MQLGTVPLGSGGGERRDDGKGEEEHSGWRTRYLPNNTASPLLGFHAFNSACPTMSLSLCEPTVLLLEMSRGRDLSSSSSNRSVSQIQLQDAQ